MKEYWITDSRFKIILIVLVIIWLGLMTFFYLKADEVTKDPCSICAKKHGENVECTMLDGTLRQRIYYPDFSIQNKLYGE